MIAFSALVTIAFILWGLIRKKSKTATLGLIILLYILFAYERSESDYLGYLEMFDQIGDGSGRALTYEYLYVLLCRVANSLHMTFDTMRKIVCFFELIFLYSTIKDFTENTALVLALFFIFPATQDAELFRWLLGMCIIIFGIKFLLKKRSILNYFLFIITVIVASLIHTSCWLFLIYLILVVKDRKKLFGIVALALVVGISLLGTGLFFSLLSYLPIRTFVIEKYQTGNYANWRGMMFMLIKQIIICMMAIIASGRLKITKGKIVLRKINYDNVCSLTNKGSSNVEICERINERILDLNLASFLMLLPMFYTSSAQRLTHVVIFFNYIALANKCTKKRQSKSYIIYGAITAVFLLLLLLFFESTGAVYAFKSHFTEGYFTNLFGQIF